MNISELVNYKGLCYWFPYYCMDSLLQRVKYTGVTGPIHLFVCVVDHFEPFNGPVDLATALSRVDVWKQKYPEFASNHRDADGNPLKHTWFYPPHIDHQVLPHILEICQAGYGEIEMHLHHNHMPPFPDTSQTLREKILRCIEDYGKLGIFVQPDGKPRFAFIHGDWSLDNSGGEMVCGINDELRILIECGCYADFTFPCLNCSQPAFANQIFYAIDDTGKPKSYNRGIPVKKQGRAPNEALMLIQGVIGLRYDGNKSFKLAIDYSDLDSNDPPTKARIDFWVQNAISINGKYDWKFIKLHTHGGREMRWDANFGEPAEQAFTYLEERYNDGNEYILHYVTAREMYNIIRAAEAGKEGDPNRYRDYQITPYPYRQT